LRAFTDRQPPEKIWEFYLLLTRVEQAFKDLKGDLSVRPLYHQLDTRIEAHIFVSFLAYCFHTTLRQMSRVHAGGLTSAAIIEKFQSVQMIDIHLPTTDGRRIVMNRHTEPEPDIQLLQSKLDLILPPQPPPQVSAHEISSVVPT
jgi:transposase